MRASRRTGSKEGVGADGGEREGEREMGVREIYVQMEKREDRRGLEEMRTRRLPCVSPYISLVVYAHTRVLYAAIVAFLL